MKNIEIEYFLSNFLIMKRIARILLKAADDEECNNVKMQKHSLHMRDGKGHNRKIVEVKTFYSAHCFYLRMCDYTHIYVCFVFIIILANKQVS